MNEYPWQKEQIQQYKRDYENYMAYKSTTDSIGYRYQVLPEETSRWGIGHTEALIQIGQVKYVYRHKIHMSLFCGEFSFTAQRAANKNINWKISDRLKGKSASSRVGDLKISFTNEEPTSYSQIEITTDKRTYTVPLQGNLLVEINADECENKNEKSEPL